MKFTVLQGDLEKGINIVSKAISARASLPVLSNVLIATDEGRLKLTATDLDKSITTWVGVKVDEEGAITVPAKIVADFVSNLPPTQIEGSLDSGILTLKSQKAEATFNGIDAAEFPMPHIGKGKVSVDIPSNSFQEALSEVSFSVANDESRPILTGVLLHFEKSKLTLVSVDGFRLSERVLFIEKEVKEPLDVVLPGRMLLEMSRILQSSKEVSLSLLSDENVAVFEGGDVIATTRILDGNFPDYRKIIPEMSNVRVEVNQEDLFNAVKIANVFAKDAANVVKVQITPGEGLFLSSEAAEVGQNRTFVDAKVEGGKMEILFDGRYLNDFLSNVKAGDLVIETEGALSPVVFKPVKRKDYLHIIMPRRP